MNPLLNKAKRLSLGKLVNRTSIASGVGGMLSKAWIQRSRKRWENEGDNPSEALDSLPESITAYALAQGAGQLLGRVLLSHFPETTLAQKENRLVALLNAQEVTLPTSPSDGECSQSPRRRKALNRLLVSKALFYLEGFKLTECRYERYQREAMDLLAPATLRRSDLFEARPFKTPEILNATHHLLALLDASDLEVFLAEQFPASLENSQLLSNDNAFLARLLAITYGLDAPEQASVIHNWYEAYRTFKLQGLERQGNLINTAITTVTGGLPKQVGLDLANRLFKTVIHSILPRSQKPI